MTHKQTQPKTNKETESNKQTPYEKENNNRSRIDLRKNLLDLFDELDDGSFHDLYGILWSMTTANMLHRIKGSQLDDARKENEHLKKLLRGVKK